jgi:hypothetical protein
MYMYCMYIELCICILYAGLLSIQDRHSRSCPIKSSTGCNDIVVPLIENTSFNSSSIVASCCHLSGRAENAASSISLVAVRLLRRLLNCGRCLQSHCLATAAVQLLILRQLSRGGCVYHGSLSVNV